MCLLDFAEFLPDVEALECLGYNGLSRAQRTVRCSNLVVNKTRAENGLGSCTF